MFVGETGVGRVIQRTVDVMTSKKGDDPRKHGAIDLETIQKYINLWYTLSLDLFGGEISTNAADYFANGLKGRAHEDKFKDHRALGQTYDVAVPHNGGLRTESVPMRNAMNEVLRDGYVSDNERGVRRWNKTLEKAGIDFRFRLPDRKFHRHIGIYSVTNGTYFDPDGKPITEKEWHRRLHEWIPSVKDREFVQNLMVGVYEVGKIASWVAPPRVGIDKHPFAWEYVRL